MVLKSFVNIALLLAGGWCCLSLQGCTSRYTLPAAEYETYRGEINQHTRLIHAEEETVFLILTHEETFQRLCPKGTVVTYETPPPYKVGTLIKARIIEKYELVWHTRVEELIPGKKIRLTFLDGFFAGGTELWELEKEGSFTRVTHTIIVQPEGFLRNLAWAIKVRGKHDERVEDFLDALKREAESPQK